MMLSLDTAYRSFGGEVEALSTPTICRLPDSRRHQLSAIALDLLATIANLGSTALTNNMYGQIARGSQQRAALDLYLLIVTGLATFPIALVAGLLGYRRAQK